MMKWSTVLLGFLVLAGCARPEPAAVREDSAEAKILRDALETRARLSWRLPAAAADHSRQDQVLGWFISQLSPGQPQPSSWKEERQGIAAALRGDSLAFPMSAAHALKPELSREKILEAWLNSDLMQSDPHARYLPPYRDDALNKVLKIYDSGLGLSVEENGAQGPGLRVSAVSDNSPASRQKDLVVGSLLLGWRQSPGKWQEPTSVDDWRVALYGEVGTRIHLRWRTNAGVVREAALDRSWWSIEAQRARGKIVRYKNLKLGVVRIPLFYMQNEKVSTSIDLRSERDRLRAQGAQILVLDLRGNPGGYWQEAIASAGVFSPGKLVAKAVPGNGVPLPLSAPLTPDPWTGPVWIWVDGNTASSSEVLAGFLREERSACIVGERTSGKGSIQIMAPVSSPFSKEQLPGSLVLTSMLYQWPSGKTPQYWGMVPDVWTVDPQRTLQIGERQLPNAIHFGIPSGKPAAGELPPDISSLGKEWLDASATSSFCLKPA